MPSRRIEIANPRNAVYVSAVSIQEIVIKQQQKRLSFPEPLLPLLDVNKFSPLPVMLAHALALRELPLLHKDPFDRQLLAQCHYEGMALITRDRTLTKYGVPFVLA